MENAGEHAAHNIKKDLKKKAKERVRLQRKGRSSPTKTLDMLKELNPSMSDFESSPRLKKGSTKRSSKRSSRRSSRKKSREKKSKKKKKSIDNSTPDGKQDEKGMTQPGILIPEQSLDHSPEDYEPRSFSDDDTWSDPGVELSREFDSPSRTNEDASAESEHSLSENDSDITRKNDSSHKHRHSTTTKNSISLKIDSDQKGASETPDEAESNHNYGLQEAEGLNQPHEDSAESSKSQFDPDETETESTLHPEPTFTAENPSSDNPKAATARILYDSPDEMNDSPHRRPHSEGSIAFADPIAQSSQKIDNDNSPEGKDRSESYRSASTMSKSRFDMPARESTQSADGGVRLPSILTPSSVPKSFRSKMQAEEPWLRDRLRALAKKPSGKETKRYISNLDFFAMFNDGAEPESPKQYQPAIPPKRKKKGAKK